MIYIVKGIGNEVYILTIISTAVNTVMASRMITIFLPLKFGNIQNVMIVCITCANTK